MGLLAWFKRRKDRAFLNRLKDIYYQNCNFIVQTENPPIACELNFLPSEIRGDINFDETAFKHAFIVLAKQHINRTDPEYATDNVMSRLFYTKDQANGFNLCLKPDFVREFKERTGHLCHARHFVGTPHIGLAGKTVDVGIAIEVRTLKNKWVRDFILNLNGLYAIKEAFVKDAVMLRTFKNDLFDREKEARLQAKGRFSSRDQFVVCITASSNDESCIDINTITDGTLCLHEPNVLGLCDIGRYQKNETTYLDYVLPSKYTNAVKTGTTVLFLAVTDGVYEKCQTEGGNRPAIDYEINRCVKRTESAMRYLRQSKTPPCFSVDVQIESRWFPEVTATEEGDLVGEWEIGDAPREVGVEEAAALDLAKACFDLLNDKEARTVVRELFIRHLVFMEVLSVRKDNNSYTFNLSVNHRDALVKMTLI